MSSFAEIQDVRLANIDQVLQKGISVLTGDRISICNYCGAEGGTRTPTGLHPLDPEPSASTNSATSAFRKAQKELILCSECIIYISLNFLSSKR